MSKTTWTARTKSQLVAALARKGYNREAVHKACDNAKRFGTWDVTNFGVLDDPANAAVILTFGDTEVDLWDARLASEEELEAHLTREHAERKGRARKSATRTDREPAVGGSLDGRGAITYVSGPNPHDFGTDLRAVDYINEHGGTGSLFVIVTPPAPAGPLTPADVIGQVNFGYLVTSAITGTDGELYVAAKNEARGYSVTWHAFRLSLGTGIGYGAGRYFEAGSPFANAAGAVADMMIRSGHGPTA